MTTLTLTETKRTLQEAYLTRVREEWQSVVNDAYSQFAAGDIFSQELTGRLHNMGPKVVAAAARFVCEEHGDLLRTYVRGFHGARLAGDSFSTADLPEIFTGVRDRKST